MPHHLDDGNVLRGLGHAGDQAGILLREEALRNDHEEIDRQRQRREEDQQRHEAELAARGRGRAHRLVSSASKPRSLHS